MNPGGVVRKLGGIDPPEGLWETPCLHIVIKQQFSTFIFAVFLLNYFTRIVLAKCCRPFLWQGCKFVSG